MSQSSFMAPSLTRPLTDLVHTVAELSALLVELMGVTLIVSSAVIGLIRAGYLIGRHSASEVVFRDVRQTLGRGLLLGLEFLVAADVIFTVLIEFTFERLLGLVVIVIIRTFLSFSLEVELTGRWPWQHGDRRHPDTVQDEPGYDGEGPEGR
jgi:uncharacterized membrane protein